MNKYLFFDNASTTKCCKAALAALNHYSTEDFGNPSSTHAFGVKAAQAVREAREFFARYFRVEPEQIIFTGSGTEANNLAITGVGTAILSKKQGPGPQLRLLSSAIEHPSVRKTVEAFHSLYTSIGSSIESHPISVSPEGEIDLPWLLTHFQINHQIPTLVSIQQVNNVVGAQLPVHILAAAIKKQQPSAIIHSDAIQAFGKVAVPVFPTPIDLLSISGHKIHGPKGVGALIVFNPDLLQNFLNPILWGGEQENGFRSGTQSPGLISGFYHAALEAIENQESRVSHLSAVKAHFYDVLISKKLIQLDSLDHSPVRWNSPTNSAPHIVNISVPGIPSGPLAKLLEERGCLVSVGSACSSGKPDPDMILCAMGLPMAVQTSSVRISFSYETQLSDVEHLAQSLKESIQLARQLLGLGEKKRAKK